MNGLYEKLLEGRLEPEERAQLVAGLKGDDDALDALLGDVDPAERELLLRLVWSEAGGVDEALPSFPEERARAAAHAGMQQREGGEVLDLGPALQRDASRRPVHWAAWGSSGRLMA